MVSLKELSQLYYLNREIEIDRERLEELRTKAEGASANLTGMPKGRSTESRVERYTVDIADMAAIIAKKQKRCMNECKRLTSYISDIPDALTRQIFTLRFVDGLDWWGVADRIGGKATDKYCSNLCYKYLKNYNEQNTERGELNYAE
jgi:hypothetical protein